MAIEANAGAKVGDYFLTRKIGEGGMAEVWLARESTSAQLRALKFLNSQYQGIPEVEARFQNEGESKLIHPNIVRIFEVGQQAGSSFIAMEFVDGHDLENILNSRRGPLTVAESVDIGTQILAGLGFAHANGIIHRDIKPSNVLVDRDGHAYVMDFGIAKVLRTGRMLTQVNSRLGTPDYMSPEQIRNPRDVDSRSDIYSFGCLFYELLTGWPPFDRGEGYETEHDIKTAHVMNPPTPPMQRKVGLPPLLNEITLKCLAKAKEDRPQSCEEVIAALYAYKLSLAPPSPNAVRGSTIVEAPPKPAFAGEPSSVPVARRETSVISAEPGKDSGAVSGGSFQNRGGTIVEPPPAPQKPVVPSQGNHVVAVPVAKLAKPPQQNDRSQKSGGFVQLFLIAAGSLFLLVALGGGGWVWYHKDHETGKQDTAKQQESAQNNDGQQETAPQKTDPVPPNNDQAGSVTPILTPVKPVKTEPVKTEPAKTEPAKTEPAKTGANTFNLPGFKPDQQTIRDNEFPRPVTKPTAAPKSGTLVWTGDASSVGRHVTIIRSSGSALEGGTVNGAMFPAGPVRVRVRPPGMATVVTPDARTNYNSLQLFLPNSGQQTIYLDWTAVPNP